MAAYPDRARLRLIIGGRVQGVGFRFAACDQANTLGLSGWVRNLSGGEVEILAEGGADELKILSAWARVGAPSAHVVSLSEEWLEATGEFSAFRIR